MVPRRLAPLPRIRCSLLVLFGRSREHGLSPTERDQILAKDRHDDPAMTSEAVAALREVKQRAAATILGLLQLTSLDFSDGELAWTGPQLAETATRLIRQERPDIVVTHDPYGGAPAYWEPQLHPDHRAVGLAVVEACYFRAPGPLFYPAQRDQEIREERRATT
jgi:LmbE family N-acetylglucosaminyl deacetylase